jgi:flagellar basal-body rod protein FlgG
VGRLRIETAEDTSTLKKEGNARFLAAGALREVSAEETRLRQGVIEESNVDPILSMVDLITIQRAYAANIDALRAMDHVLGVVASDVGKA